jgi:hypothetical protein
MKSIYDAADSQELITRFNQLTPNSEALWGNMTVDQMLQHCTAAIEVAFNEKEVKVNFMMKVLGRLVKNKIFNSEFRQNSPTAKEFIFEEQYDFESSKAILIEKFSRFSTIGTSAITELNHPFWGKMTYEDWNKLVWKHLDHHLRQFGV